MGGIVKQTNVTVKPHWCVPSKLTGCLPVATCCSKILLRKFGRGWPKTTIPSVSQTLQTCFDYRTIFRTTTCVQKKQRSTLLHRGASALVVPIGSLCNLPLQPHCVVLSNSADRQKNRSANVAV